MFDHEPDIGASQRGQVLLEKNIRGSHFCPIIVPCELDRADVGDPGWLVLRLRQHHEPDPHGTP